MDTPAANGDRQEETLAVAQLGSAGQWRAPKACSNLNHWMGWSSDVGFWPEAVN
jgi:hypothetical protein